MFIPHNSDIITELHVIKSELLVYSFFSQNCEFISILTSKHTDCKFISCNSDFFLRTSKYKHKCLLSSIFIFLLFIWNSYIWLYFYLHSFGSLTVAQICTAKAAVVETMRFGGKRNLKMKLHCIFVTRDHETWENLWCQNSSCNVWLCASVKETAGIFVIQRKHLPFLNRSFHVIMRCSLAVKCVIRNVLLRRWLCLSYLEEIKSSSVHILLSLDASVALQLPSLSCDITK